MSVTESRTVIVGSRVRVPLELARHQVARGVASVLAGLVLVLWPSSWIFVVTVLVGAAALAVGVAELYDAATRRRLGERWGLEVLRALLLTSFGLYLLAWSSQSEAFLARLAGGVWLACGLLELLQIRRRPRVARAGRWRALRGLASLGAGGALLAWPDVTPAVIAHTLGAGLVLGGLACFGLTRVLRDAGRHRPDVRLEVVS